MSLTTERFALRQWRADDLAPFAALNADPDVMRHFARPLTTNESDALAERSRAAIERCGWGLWAMDCLGCVASAERHFVGFVGGHPITDVYPFGPAVSLAWRLSPTHWDRGLATAAASLSLARLHELEVGPIVAFTALRNTRSRRLMERLNMRFAGEFMHPSLAEGHPLRPHCLYTA